MRSDFSSNNDQTGSFLDSTLTISSFKEETDLPRRLTTISLPPSTPIFMIDGFMTFEVMNAWGDVIANFKQQAALKQTPCPPLYRLLSGGLISAHDMAVSVFYQIKGGREDFGEFHSNKHQHERFGFTYKGIYPEWSGELPGGNIILELQKLLDEQFFHNEKGETYSTDGGWVLSAAMVSSPLRGSTVAYKMGTNLGERGTIRFLSSLRLFFTIAYIWEWLLTLGSQEGRLGLHFRLSHFKLFKDRSVFNLLRKLFTFQLFDKGLDNAVKDLVIEKYLAAPFHTHQNTFYRSYATSMNCTPSAETENPNSYWLPILSYFSKYITQFDIRNEGKGLLDFMLPNEALWLINDGLVPLYSQFHPKDCQQQICHHLELPTSYPFKNYFPFNIYPGTWYTSFFPNSSHLDLIPGFDNQVEIPYLISWFFIICSWLQITSSPNCPDFTSSKNVSPIGSTKQLYRHIFMEDYFKFLEKVNLFHNSLKLSDSHSSKPYL